tara:strand:- start:1003 stop:1869 length:867 start_codon:yes stop_codon:yes gene_type:complete
MKDGYSFDMDKESAIHAYNRHMITYLRTYERLGLKALPMKADTGPIGGDYSHEFLVLAETGESQVFYDKSVTDLSLGNRNIDYSDQQDVADIVKKFTQPYARTDETHDENLFNEIPIERRLSARGIEVGQIFYFGTKYSNSMGADIVMPNGDRTPVEMGSHGIGVSRLVGALIEANHDELGIIWPASVTPFDAVIINLKQGDEELERACSQLYEDLILSGFDILYDDRHERVGVKFATMDLIGIPWQIIVGPRDLTEGFLELKFRADGSRRRIPLDEGSEQLVNALRA